MEHSGIGEWSQAKMEIVRDYGKEYSKILAKQEQLSHAYIDAFAGSGVHVLRTTGEMVPGSPLNALERAAVRPPRPAPHRLHDLWLPIGLMTVLGYEAAGT
jgi:hypothetical protein